jgi:hypothetical protein
MDNGLEPGNLCDVRDNDYRWELYMDWKSLKQHLPNF